MHSRSLSLLIGLLFCLPVGSKAQNGIEYSDVVELNNASGDVLYSNALVWFAEFFNDSRAVIETKDREAGIILGDGRFNYTAPSGTKYKDVSGTIEFRIKVMFKEGRSKIELTNFRHKPSFPSYSLGLITDSENYSGPKKSNMLSDKWHQVLWTDLRNDTSIGAEEILKHFKEYMFESLTKTEDW